MSGSNSSGRGVVRGAEARGLAAAALPPPAPAAAHRRAGRIKLLLVLLAGLNLLLFYVTGVARSVEGMPANADAPPVAKVFAGLSLVFWVGVIYFGRMIMYNGTLLYSMGM